MTELLADNDVVLYDRLSDPEETVNLAADPVNHELVATYLARLEALIDAELVHLDEARVATHVRALLVEPVAHGGGCAGRHAASRS